MRKLTDTQLVILSAASRRDSLNLLPLPQSLKGSAAQKVMAGLLAKGFAAEIDAMPIKGDPIWRTEGDRPLTLMITEQGLAAIGIGSEEAGEAAGRNDAEAQATSEAEAAKADSIASDTAPATTKPRKRAQTARRRSIKSKAAKRARNRVPARAPRPAKGGATPREPRSGTKQAKLIAMLKRPKGATVAEIADTFRWQHHTVRGAIAGALKNRLGLTVTSAKDDKRGRVYRIA